MPAQSECDASPMRRCWKLPATARPDLCVPARVFVDEELAQAILRDRSLEQL